MTHSVYVFITFSALRDEYDRGDGDLEIICDGDNRIICHSCIVECQSRIMRRSIVRKSQDGLLLPRAQLRYYKINNLKLHNIFKAVQNSQYFKCESCWELCIPVSMQFSIH